MVQLYCDSGISKTMMYDEKHGCDCFRRKETMIHLLRVSGLTSLHEHQSIFACDHRHAVETISISIQHTRKSCFQNKLRPRVWNRSLEIVPLSFSSASTNKTRFSGQLWLGKNCLIIKILNMIGRNTLYLASLCVLIRALTSELFFPALERILWQPLC